MSYLIGALLSVAVNALSDSINERSNYNYKRQCYSMSAAELAACSRKALEANRTLPATDGGEDD